MFDHFTFDRLTFDHLVGQPSTAGALFPLASPPPFPPLLTSLRSSSRLLPRALSLPPICLSLARPSLQVLDEEPCITFDHLVSSNLTIWSHVQVLEEELYALLIDIYRSPKAIRVLSDHA
jgi:hypothetical protein